jgi:hypothetical protein
LISYFFSEKLIYRDSGSIYTRITTLTGSSA